MFLLRCAARYFTLPSHGVLLDNARYYYIPGDVLAPRGQRNTLVVFDEVGASSIGSVQLVLSSLS